MSKRDLAPRLQQRWLARISLSAYFTTQASEQQPARNRLVFSGGNSRLAAELAPRLHRGLRQSSPIREIPPEKTGITHKLPYLKLEWAVDSRRTGSLA